MSDPALFNTVDKHAAYAPAFDALQHDGTLPETWLRRPCKQLNFARVFDLTNRVPTSLTLEGNSAGSPEPFLSVWRRSRSSWDNKR